MSRETLHTPHVSVGRTPWRRWLQLRPDAAIPSAKSPAAAAPLDTLDAFDTVYTLRHAARNAEPPRELTPCQRDEARALLWLVCDWLDARMDAPLGVSNLGDGQHLLIFLDSIGYEVDTRRRTITSGSITRQDYYVARFDNPELGRPFTEPHTVYLILQSLELLDRRQGDLFFDGAPIGITGDWLVATLHTLLLRHPVIQRLRERTLPELLSIPRDILSIALACRAVPLGPVISAHELCMVWRHEAPFRQVARENPQLLPLILIQYQWRVRAPIGMTESDPVRQLKTDLLHDRQGSAVWRYVVRHGARLFKPVWEITRNQMRMHAARFYLNALEAAGLPPPPPPSIVRAFLHSYNANFANRACIVNGFHGAIHRGALRAALLEADRRRRTGTVAGFIDEFLGVCRWSERRDITIDRNQARAGWPWLAQRWQHHERIQACLEGIESRHWQTRLRAFASGNMTIIPIQSSAALILEAIAMRNCLDTCIDRCASGDLEIYSVRDSATGKRHGCVGITFDDAARESPALADARRYANLPSDSRLMRIGEEIVLRLRMLPMLPGTRQPP